MLTVETIAKVRREHAKGKSARQIAKALRLSRTTVTKYLALEVTEVHYDRKKQHYPQLEQFLPELEKLLTENDHKPPRDRLDYKHIFHALVQIDYQGKYDAVRRYCKQWKSRHKPESGVNHAFVPLIYSPGEAYQFDWSEDWIILKGVSVKVQVAHVRLCHSRMPYVFAYLRQAQEMVFDAHERAFMFWGGTCERGIYDNMKTAVHTVYIGKDRKFNERFAQMCSHYLIEPTACTPRAGWEKGQVENQVGTVRERCFKPRPRVSSLDELNEWLQEQCILAAKASPHPEISGKTVWDVFETERNVLVKLAGPFDGYREINVPASKTCLIRFDNNRYSVDAKAANKPVQLRIYAERLELRLDGELVADHARSFGRDKTIYNPLHYIPILARKPGALRNGAPFREWSMPAGLAGIQARIGRSNEGDRQFADILAAILTDGLDAVEAACKTALSEGVCKSEVIINILSRQKRPPAPPPVNVPEKLTLKVPPVANCNRYNTLLTQTSELAHGTA